MSTVSLSSSEARKGEQVTTLSANGGVGLGFLVGGIVWVATGSFWACRADQDVFPMVSYQRDGGKGYLEKAARYV